MASNEPEMANSKFHNWVKTGLAMKYTKEGLQDAVAQELQNFHSHCYDNVLKRKGLPVGTLCSSCTTKSIMICSTTNKVCKRIGQRCQSKHHPCSQGICEDVRDNIIKAHRYKDPSFKNSDAQRWCIDFFEVLKCYLPQEGYADKSTLDDIDFNGILSIVISFDDFQNKIAENLKIKNNTFLQAREIGRMFRHSPNCEVSDIKFESTIEVFTAVLTDPKYFVTLQKSKEATEKLEKLRSASLTEMDKETSEIFNGIVDVLKDMKETFGNMKKHTELFIQKSINELSVTFDQEKMKSIGSEIVLNAHTDPEVTHNESYETLQSDPLLGRNTKNDAVLFKHGEVEILHNHRGRRDKGCFPRRRARNKEFRIRLKQNYEDKNSMLQVSPLLQEEDAPLLDLYVPPNMKILEHHRIQSKDISVTSYIDIFFKNSKECKNIYVTGDAGIGKTAFCQRMILAWCYKTETKRVLCFKMKGITLKEHLFSEKDLQVMKSFDFLFYISLRDTKLCHVEDMIIQQIGCCSSRNFLDFILNKYKCLIIMDGLDEWNHPTNQTNCPPGDKVPHRQSYKNCTVVTTSRTSKLDVIRLSTSEIDQQVAITGIGAEQYETLVRAVVKILNSKLNKDCNPETFIALMKRKNLLDLSQIPIIDMQLLCQWYEKDSLDNRKSIVYGNTIQMLFSRSKQLDLKPISEQSLSFPKHWEKVPVLLHLGQFAYVTLFSVKESNLVFNYEYTEGTDQTLHGLNKREMETLISSGIISRNKVNTSLTERKFELQFIHRSFHEFMAAVYIAMEQYDPCKLSDLFSDVSNFLEFSNVLVFLASISPNVFEQLNNFLLKLLCKDEHFIEYRKSHFPGFISYKSNVRYNRFRACHASLNAIQSLCLICARESDHIQCPDKVVQLTDIYIEDETQVKNPDFQNLLKSQTILSLSTTCIITDWSCVESLVKLCTEGNCSEYYVNNLEKFPHLQCLVISICNIQTPLDLLRLHELRSLNLFQVVLDQEENCEISFLAEYLRQHTLLTQISLVDVTCTKHKEASQDKKCTVDLSKHTSLITLDLRRVPIIVTDLNTKELESCIVETDVQIPPSLINCLKLALKLECLTIDLDKYVPSRDGDISLGKSLTDIIPTLECLRNIKLVNIDFENEVLRFSPQMKVLENIKLWWNRLSVPSLQSIIETLPETDNNTNIELNRCKILSDSKLSRHARQLGEFKSKLTSEVRIKIIKYNFTDTQELSFELVSVSNPTNV